MAALPFTATTSNFTSTSSGELCTKISSCRSNWVLNREGCCIKTAEDKGRGVYGEQSHLDLRIQVEEKIAVGSISRYTTPDRDRS